MENKNTKKSKHLILDDRIEIQECLYHGMTFKAIAGRIGKDQTSVFKEVKALLVVNTDDVKSSNIYGESIISEICPTLFL